VQGLASLQQEAVVGNVLDDGVLEDVGRFRHEPLLIDDLQSLQLTQQPCEALTQPGDTRQQPHQELPTDHRGHLHGAFRVVPETVQAGHNDPLDGVRDMHLTESFHETVATIVALEHAQIEQGLRHFLNEQRHALGFVQQSGLEFCGKLRCAEDLARHHQRLGLGETMQRQRGGKAATPKRRRVADPVRDQEQQRHARDGVQQKREELFTAGVDPMQVFDDQHEGASLCATE
jgi:hypothetical protein